jgi:sugar lactone lactonase YvrE
VPGSSRKTPRAQRLRVAARTPETEPNNTIASATPFALGDQATGTITPAGDVDYWAIALPAATTVDIRVTAATAGSALDSEIILVASDGTTRLAYSDDAGSADSRIIHTVGPAGTYFIGIADFFGRGGAGYTYAIDVTILTCESGYTETEPNNDPATATAVTLGTAATGVLCPGGDVDFYSFTATAGQILELDIDASQFGSPLDPTLELLAADGTTRLAFNDDSDGLDSRIRLAVTTTGTYYVAVRDIDDLGGPEFQYTLHARAIAPGPGDATISRAFDLGAPLGIAVRSDGALLVGDVFGGRIRRIDLASGAVTMSLVPSPVGMTMDALGYLLVASFNGTVYRVNPWSGVVSPFIGGINAFWVAAGPDGTLWVTDPSLGNVHRYNALGQQTGTFSAVSLGGLGPGPLTVDPGGQPCFSVGDRIYRINPAGGMELILTTEGVVWGFTFDAAGNIYATNPVTRRILRFSPSGTVLDDPYVAGILEPRAVAFGRDATGTAVARLFSTNLQGGSLEEVNPSAVAVAGITPVAVLSSTVAAAALDLLGGAGIPAADRALLDAMGNRNGRFDVGDLRAVVLSGLLASAVTPGTP